MKLRQLRLRYVKNSLLLFTFFVESAIIKTLKKGAFPMFLLCYPKCSTCKKAQAWLDERGVAYEYRDIKTDNPTYDELKLWYEKSGLPLKRFFNTSGLAYRNNNLKDKLPEMTEEEQLRLLATDGMLVKRPLAVGDDFVLPGFREKEWVQTF